MDDSKNQTGNARLLNMPGRRDQMLRTMLLCALTAAIFFLPFYIIVCSLRDSGRVECIRLHRVMYFIRARRALNGYSFMSASLKCL